MPEPAPIPYKRLPGSGTSRRGSSIISVARVSSRLWLGDDHLLQVESAGGYSESYKRFYFRDIQAICVRRTKSWFAGNMVLGIFTGSFLLWALSIKDTAGIVALAIITSVCGFFLLLNLARGATCACHLKTAVHLEELPSLGRYRNAKKVLARIKPLIEAAQGSAPTEVIAEQYGSLLASANAAAAAPGQVTRLADSARRRYDSRVHQFLFLALLADCLADIIDIFAPGVPAVLLNILVSAVLGGLAVIALVKQHQTDLKPALRGLTWIIGGFVGISYLAGYITMVLMIPTHKFDGTQWGYVKALAGLQPFETPWWLASLSIGAALSGILGVSGLLLLNQQRRERNISA